MATQKIEVRMPLFDRLVDRDPRLPHELRPTRTLDRRGLRESVRRELEQLFNTRCPFPAHRLPIRERSVIDYGVPDFSVFSPRSYDDRVHLAELLRRTFHRRPRLPELAAAAGMSRFHFHRRFKLHLGETPLQMTTRLQIDQAKRLLSDACP